MSEMLNKDLEENPLESPDSLFAFSEDITAKEPAKDSEETPDEAKVESTPEGDAPEAEAAAEAGEDKPEGEVPEAKAAAEATDSPAAGDEAGTAQEAGEAVGDAVDDLEKILGEMSLGDDNKEAEKQIRSIMEKLSQTQIQLMESNMDRDGYKGKWIDSHGQLSELEMKKPLLDSIEQDPQLLMFIRLNADESEGAKTKKVDFLANKIQELTGVDVLSVIQNNQQSATSMNKTGGMEELPQNIDDQDLPELFGGRSR